MVDCIFCLVGRFDSDSTGRSGATGFAGTGKDRKGRFTALLTRGAIVVGLATAATTATKQFEDGVTLHTHSSQSHQIAAHFTGFAIAIDLA